MEEKGTAECLDDGWQGFCRDVSEGSPIRISCDEDLDNL